MKKNLLLFIIILFGLHYKSFSQFETDMNGNPCFLGIQLNSNKKEFMKSLLTKNFQRIDSSSYTGLGYTVILKSNGFIFILDNTESSSISDALSNYENCYKIMKGIYKEPWKNTEFTYKKSSDFTYQKTFNYEAGKYDISEISTMWVSNTTDDKTIYLFLNLAELSNKYKIYITCHKD